MSAAIQAPGDTLRPDKPGRRHPAPHTSVLILPLVNTQSNRRNTPGPNAPPHVPTSPRNPRGVSPNPTWGSGAWNHRGVVAVLLVTSLMMVGTTLAFWPRQGLSPVAADQQPELVAKPVEVRSHQGKPGLPLPVLPVPSTAPDEPTMVIKAQTADGAPVDGVTVLVDGFPVPVVASGELRGLGPPGCRNYVFFAPLGFVFRANSQTELTIETCEHAVVVTLDPQAG